MADVNYMAKSTNVNADNNSSAKTVTESTNEVNGISQDAHPATCNTSKLMCDSDAIFTACFVQGSVGLPKGTSDQEVESSELCSNCSEFMEYAHAEISTNFGAFIKVGNLLRIIKQFKLYRATNTTFGAYWDNLFNGDECDCNDEGDCKDNYDDGDDEIITNFDFLFDLGLTEDDVLWVERHAEMALDHILELKHGPNSVIEDRRDSMTVEERQKLQQAALKAAHAFLNKQNNN